MKILIIHSFGIGDMIMFTPTLKEIKTKYPDSIIDFLIFQKPSAEPIKNCKYTNEIFYTTFHYKDLIKNIFLIRKKLYDISIYTSGANPIKASIYSFLLGAKLRIGEYMKYKLPLYTEQVKFNANIHRVESNLSLINQIANLNTKPLFCLDQDSENYSLNFLSKFQTSTIIGIHPGCNQKYANKRWEIEKYISLIKLIEVEYQFSKILIFIGPDEKDVGKEIKNNIPNIILIENNLQSVSAIISKLDLMITNDSGLGHIASCFNINILTIFSKYTHANPTKIKPFSSKSHIINFKNHRVGVTIEVNEVFKTITEILNKNKALL